MDEMKDKNTSSKWSLKEPLFLDKTDDRYKDQLKQLKEDGFSDTETWSLYTTMAEFILPRLRRFKEITPAYPMGSSMEKWQEQLGEMIFAFEWTLAEDEMTEEYQALNEEDKKANWERHEAGMALFGEAFMGLWW